MPKIHSAKTKWNKERRIAKHLKMIADSRLRKARRLAAWLDY